MKRNMHLVRGILMEIESLPPAGVYWSEDSRLDAGRDVIAAHLLLLNDAGFVSEFGQERSGPAFCTGLSWAGQEFLDAVRSNEVWSAAHQLLREKGVASVSADVLRELCSSLAKRLLGLK